MLHLILGAAGTGKTTLLHEKIDACVKDGGKAILIVPEQYSFESEKALYRRLGAKDALSVEVLSFTRLCDRIFRQLGGVAGVHMDEAAKYLLMSVALGELGDSLCAYHKSSTSAAFVASMCETVSELKTAGVVSNELRGIARRSGERVFADKLNDIALIFDAYQAIIERGYSDPDDSLKRACKRLEGEDFFSGYHVFIDGFMAFMGAEWKLLGVMLNQCPDVTAALTCAGLDTNDKTGVFAAVVQTANRLIQLAKQGGSRVAAPVVLREQKRFRNPALARIAAEYPQLQRMRCDFEVRGVQVAACEDVYDELEYIAAQVSRLVRAEGYRYRDIALIGRGLERYLVPLQTVFERYGIPFFTDMRADIEVYPLISGVLCALDAVRSNFTSEYMLALAKNCITGIPCVEAGELENYCFLWGISGSTWTADFVNNPDGMIDGTTDEQTARLEELNVVRRRLAEPLMRMKRSLDGCDGYGFAQSVFTWLEETGAAQNLQDSVQGCEDVESKQFLETGAQVWDILIGLLDAFGGALEGVHMKLSRLIDLLRMGITAVDVGNLPQTLDQVIVGMADRIRPNEPKAVFIIGLNEGQFPLWSTPGGIFSAAERDRLKAQGIDLLQTPEQSALFEKYYVYFALTQASERLWLTYPMRDTAGNGLTPSSVAAQVMEITGDIVCASAELPLRERVYNRRTALDFMARGWRTPTPAEAALKAYFARQEPEQLACLESFAGTRAFRMNDTASARALFGWEMQISPSRVERYYNCPFSYFCQVGLRLNPRRRVEFNPIESGSLIHLVLEKIVKKYGGKGLCGIDEDVLRAEISAIVTEDLKSKIQDFEGMPARFKYLFGRLVSTLMRLIRRLALEFAQSAFEPAAFELPIRQDAEYQPLDLRTADGARVIVEGVVDRMDVFIRDGVKYVRVVDYKSGRKTFSLSDVFYGLNMQMLIYLFSICEHAPENTLPAGVLYMPARDSIISAERGATNQEIQNEQVKRLKMSGILLEDREALSAMEPDLAGVFIPVKTKKDGSFDARSSVANLAQMGLIKRKVENLVVDIAYRLHRGDIEAAPVEGLAGYAPCGWCDYHAICAHEDTDKMRQLSELDKNRIFELMRKEENDV